MPRILSLLFKPGNMGLGWDQTENTGYGNMGVKPDMEIRSLIEFPGEPYEKIKAKQEDDRGNAGSVEKTEEHRQQKEADPRMNP